MEVADAVDVRLVKGVADDGEIVYQKHLKTINNNTRICFYTCHFFWNMLIYFVKPGLELPNSFTRLVNDMSL